MNKTKEILQKKRKLKTKKKLSADNNGKRTSDGREDPFVCEILLN